MLFRHALAALVLAAGLLATGCCHKGGCRPAPSCAPPIPAPCCGNPAVPPAPAPIQSFSVPPVNGVPH
jgi:hypothetical protein